MLKKLLFAGVAAILPVAFAGAATTASLAATELVGVTYFEPGKAVVSKDMTRVIEDVFRKIDVPECANITLVGRGCEAGKNDANEILGMQRAMQTRRILMQRGFSHQRIAIKFVGIKYPTYLWTSVYPDQECSSAVEIYQEPPHYWYDDFRCRQILGKIPPNYPGLL